MGFSIKQLLLCMAFIAIGLTALANADKPFAKELIDLLTLGTLIFMAYAAWTTLGERRAFRVGFVSWGVLYYWLFKLSFDIGTMYVLNLASRAFRTVVPQATSSNTDDLFGPPVTVSPYLQQAPSNNSEAYYSIGNALFLLLFAFVGGWVTVYFYRKRQTMLSR